MIVCKQTLNKVLDDHAPLKTKKVRASEPPFMNMTLKRAILNKTRLRRRFNKTKTDKAWKLYCVQRNKTTSIRRASIRKYFQERCEGGPKNADFYKTIKPFLSSKNKTNSTLMIKDDERILTEPKDVADSMNAFYTNIAAQIGTDTSIPTMADFDTVKDFVDASVDYHSAHPSINAIKTECNKANNFNFSHVNPDEVHDIISNLNPKKATGADGIPAKALILANDIIAPEIAMLYNKCVDTCKFPLGSKVAEVVPIYKKNDALERKNHRPVSLLTSKSIVLEKLMEKQMNDDFLPHVYNDCLSAFRAGYSCQHVLLSLTDTWRVALENKNIPGALLVDLSKAFDCLPHSLIVAELQAYGASPTATELLANYLTNRKQRVKVGGTVSDWNEILKGIPQGSILGPIAFNIFMNDVFCAIKDGILFNYADDNTVVVQSKTKAGVLDKISQNSNHLITWCTVNQMEANASKFQVMIANESSPIKIDIQNTTIHSEPHVKLLGVHLDNKLNFNQHISHITKSASRQLNCLKRIARFLDTPTKLLLYKSFVLSNFNYCPAVWHACGAENTRKLEKVQLRALRFVFNDYTNDYATLLQLANLPSLEISRLRFLAIEVFKARNGLSPNYISDMFKSTTHKYSLRSKNTLSQTHKRTVIGGTHTFQHTGVQIWNSLPNNLRTTTDIKVFKRLIKTWKGFKCKCASCMISSPAL
jgi:hypothetical protein